MFLFSWEYTSRFQRKIDGNSHACGNGLLRSALHNDFFREIEYSDYFTCHIISFLYRIGNVFIPMHIMELRVVFSIDVMKE